MRPCVEVKMKKHISLVASAALAAAVLPPSSPARAQSVAESKLPQSNVSVLVEPRLSDGRLVIKVAAKNLGTSPVPFGPTNVGVARPDGQAIAIYPLSSLVEDVRLAAGLSPATASRTVPTHGAHAAPRPTTTDGGQMDVTGFTGGSTVGGDEYVRQSNRRKSKPTISSVEAEAQIAALKQVILQDSTLQPGQIAAGQVVTEQLKFAKGEDRTLHLRIRVAGDQHDFTIQAPKE